MPAVTDACELIKQLCESDSNYVANTNGSSAPIFQNANRQKKVNVGSSVGLVKIYEVTDLVAYDSYNARKRHDRVIRCSLDFMGFRTRDLMLSHVRRVRQILEYYQSANLQAFSIANVGTQTYTNPFQLMWEVDSTDLSRSGSDSHHRYVMDVELTVLGQVRTTAL